MIIVGSHITNPLGGASKGGLGNLRPPSTPGSPRFLKASLKKGPEAGLSFEEPWG